MDFRLTKEEALFQKMCREFALNEVEPVSYTHLDLGFRRCNLPCCSVLEGQVFPRCSQERRKD